MSRTRSRSSLDRAVARRPEEAEAVAGDAAHRQEEVVAHREVAEQERGLVRASQPHADALVGRQRGHVLTEESHPAPRGREVAGDDVEQRGLAGAVGADHGTALPHGDRERDVLDRAQGAERPGDALQHEGVPETSVEAISGSRLATQPFPRRATAPPGRAERWAWGPLRGPHYGQLGSSREPILNSAGGTPSVWFTLSIFLSTLL